MLKFVKNMLYIQQKYVTKNQKYAIEYPKICSNIVKNMFESVKNMFKLCQKYVTSKHIICTISVKIC